MTLRALIASHPEWLDHHLAVRRPDGELEFVGTTPDAAVLYEGEDVVTMTSDTDPTPTLVKVVVIAPLS